MHIAGFEVEPSGFTPQYGAVYAMICEECGPIEARELAIALLRVSSFKGHLKRACFYGGQSVLQEPLSKQIEMTMLQHPGEDIALVVSPYLGLGIEPGGKMTEMALVAFLDELEREIWAAEFPVVLAFHTEGLYVDPGLLERECAMRGFVRMRVCREDVTRGLDNGLNDRELEAVASASSVVAEGEAILAAATNRRGPGLLE